MMEKKNEKVEETKHILVGLYSEVLSQYFFLDTLGLETSDGREMRFPVSSLMYLYRLFYNYLTLNNLTLIKSVY